MATSKFHIPLPTKITPFIWLMVAVGLFLVLLGLLGLPSRDDETLEAFLIGGGLGIVFASFGSQAIIDRNGYVITGAAAVALIVIASMVVARKQELDGIANGYVRGTIDLPEDYRVTGISFPDGVEFYHTDANAARFFLLNEHMNNETATINLIHLAGNQVSLRIPKECFATYDRDDRFLGWLLRPDPDGRLVLYDGEAVIGEAGRPAPAGACDGRRPKNAVEASIGAALLGAFLPTPAQAQILAGPVDDAVPTLSQDDLSRLSRELVSDDIDTRRRARDELAAGTVADVPSIVGLLSRDTPAGDVYRIELGVAVGLAGILRADRSRAPAIDTILTTEDIARLVALAGADDRTLRVYATEFLFDLGSPEAAALALARAADPAAGVEARYQWLFASREGWRFTPEAMRVDLRPLLVAASDLAGPANPRTQDLVATILDIPFAVRFRLAPDGVLTLPPATALESSQVFRITNLGPGYLEVGDCCAATAGGTVLPGEQDRLFELTPATATLDPRVPDTFNTLRAVAGGLAYGYYEIVRP